jgi:predicted small lipoprotein YifL
VIHRRQRLIKKKPLSTQRAASMLFAAILAISAVFSVASCGKKGPPLAPLIKLPVPPPDLVAARRGDVVGVSFTVPSTNTDGTRPANVAHAEVYAITAPVTVPPISDASLMKFGTRIGNLEVKAPRDPNHTADEDDPSDEVDAPEGPGLDQGAVARLTEPLTRDMLAPVTVPPGKNAPAAPAPRTETPLLGPPTAVPVRTYVVVGTSTRGRKGPLSKRVIVPLVPPPPPPSGAAITYDESAVTLTWSPAAPAAAAGNADLLPARVIGVAPPPVMAYNVYDATKPDAVVKLNAAPLNDPKYLDNRIVWGEKRCYVIVVAETIDGAAIESEAPPPACETLVDTFPPAAPKDLKSIASEGAINLIWEPNAEKDLAGYIVLRGVEPVETLQPITPSPIVEPSFKDNVKPGVAYAYAVRAVDKAGNIGPPSARTVDTAR